MPASAFDKRNVSSSRQPWSFTFAPGAALANLFALYPSRGNATIATATSIPSTLDGPIQVVRYGALTVNAALTVTNRCRGLVILADSLSMGSAGSISMTARGAAGSSKWANQDIGIPTSLILSGKNTSQKAFLDWIASTGYCVFDPTLFACPVPGMGDVLSDYTTWAAKMSALVAASTCGAGADGVLFATGRAGGAGTNAPGGGGSGGAGNTFQSPPGGRARVWGGGVGSGGICYLTYQTPETVADQYGGTGGAGRGTTGSGCGGGAGNNGGSGSSGGAAGGNGSGGVLLVIVRGAVTLTAGHALTANGVAGGAGASTNGFGGGGSGGGFVGLYYGGTLTGTPNLTATAGAGGALAGSGYAGGAGGAGATTSATFAAKGWT